MPAPASLVTLPPKPIMILDTPNSKAALIISPVPKVDVSNGFRCDDSIR